MGRAARLTSWERRPLRRERVPWVRAGVTLTWMKGKSKPTAKLHSQCTLPPTMKAEDREDCRKISVMISAGMGPAGGGGRAALAEGRASRAHQGSWGPRWVPGASGCGAGRAWRVCRTPGAAAG